MIGVLSNEERHKQMALAPDFPRLKKRGRFSDRRISIACYGPSLKETWKDIKGPVMTVSGAHDFLQGKGVIPDWHVDCDPRPHKAEMVTPNGQTRYLMASVCHPDWWAKLKGRKVTLWHLINGDDLQTVAWVYHHDPKGHGSLIGGGSTVGMRAMNVAAALGFRRFDIYGMDGSYTDDLHAGPHGGKRQQESLVRVGSRQFKTTPQLLQSAREMEDFLQTYDAEVTFHGDGLIQEMSRAIQLRKAA